MLFGYFCHFIRFPTIQLHYFWEFPRFHFLVSSVHTQGIGVSAKHYTIYCASHTDIRRLPPRIFDHIFRSISYIPAYFAVNQKKAQPYGCAFLDGILLDLNALRGLIEV